LLALPGRHAADAAAAAAANKLAVMAPQVQVIDGNIVINPQSLTVNAAAEKDVGMTEFKRVEESGSRLNSATYSNRAKAEKWSKEDTELFYRAMTQFGTDFSLIARLFPGRSRRQVKRKYLIEDRADPRRVEQAIKSRDQDPMMYKNLIAVLQAQATEGAEQPPALARVVLDGENEETPAIADAEEPTEPEVKDAGDAAPAKPKSKARKAPPAKEAPPPAKAARASTRATRSRA
jgi:transcription factor TFIIIB component B''